MAAIVVMWPRPVLQNFVLLTQSSQEMLASISPFALEICDDSGIGNRGWLHYTCNLWDIGSGELKGLINLTLWTTYTRNVFFFYFIFFNLHVIETEDMLPAS